MKYLRLAAGAFAVAVLAATAASHAAQIDPRAQQLIAESGKALGIPSLASVDTLQFDGTVSAVGLHGTGTQYVGLRDGRFAETTNARAARVARRLRRQGQSGTPTARTWCGIDGGDSDRASASSTRRISRATRCGRPTRRRDVTSLGTKIDAGKTYDALQHHARRLEGAVRAVVRPHDASAGARALRQRLHHADARLLRLSRACAGSTSRTQFTSIRATATTPMSTVTACVRSARRRRRAGAAGRRSRPTSRSRTARRRTTVPITLGENHVYLDVMLNGKGPYHFIFDTGGSNVVDPAVAKEIGAFGTGSAQGSGVGSQTEALSFANVSNAASRRRGGQRPALCRRADAHGLRRVGGGRPSRRIDRLGSAGALRHDVRLRGQLQVTLSMPGSAPPPASGHVVPFVFYGTQPQIACTIDGIPAECTIDTGARDTISLHVAVRRRASARSFRRSMSAVGVNGFGFGGPRWVSSAASSRSASTTSQLTNLVADYSTQTAGALAAPFVAANIGGNLLRRFTVTFDYGNGTMTLVPNAGYARPTAYERSGLFLIKREGSIVVVDSRAGNAGGERGHREGRHDRLD